MTTALNTNQMMDPSEQEQKIQALERELEKYRQQALLDFLTGLPNRRWLYQMLKKRIAESVRYRRPLSVMLIDVDNFKHINDTYGHLTGDHLLKEIASELVTATRGSDSACHLSGDEFFFILPETDLSQAALVAERLEKKVSENVSIEGKSIGISCGVATINESDESVESLIDRADKAMYDRKSEKRKSI